MHISAPRRIPAEHDLRAAYSGAGGIGVTPLLSMAEPEAAGQGIYAAFLRALGAEAPLLDELREICGSSLRCWFSGDGDRFDPAVIGPSDPHAHVYMCGPRLLGYAAICCNLPCARGLKSMSTAKSSNDDRRKFKPEPSRQRWHQPVRAFSCPPTGVARCLARQRFRHAVVLRNGRLRSCECGYRNGVVLHRTRSCHLQKAGSADALRIACPLERYARPLMSPKSCCGRGGNRSKARLKPKMMRSSGGIPGTSNQSNLAENGLAVMGCGRR